MHVKDLTHGEISTLSLVALGLSSKAARSLASSFKPGQEVRLSWNETLQEARLFYAPDRFLEVKGKDKSHHERLWRFHQSQRPLIAWVIQAQDETSSPPQTPSKGQGKRASPASHQGEAARFLAIDLQIHTFATKLAWEEEIVLGVDDRVVKRIKQVAGGVQTGEDALHWLASEFLLPQALALSSAEEEPLSSRGRLILQAEPSQGNQLLCLLGRTFQATVDLSTPTPCLTRMVRYRSASQDLKSPSLLMEVPLSFVDATDAGLMRTAVRDQLAQITEEAGSYLSLWRKYQEIEEQQILRRALSLKWLKYKECKEEPSGSWWFQFEENEEERDAFLEALASDRFEIESLEASTQIAAELSYGTFDREKWNEGGKKRGNEERSWIGEIEEVDRRRGRLLLRPLREEEEKAEPPLEGYLFASLLGDRIRMQRRRFAIERMWSAEAGIPELSLLIEGLPCSPRKAQKERAFSQATLALFGKNGPTPSQREAVEIALSTPDIAVIQGPPGTGKTKVLTAIQNRLAEVAKEKTKIQGSTLLSSFQHDAVDHAASLSEALGLPALRFGGRQGEESSAERLLETWRLGAEEKVRARLAATEISQGEPWADYRSLRDRGTLATVGAWKAEEVQPLLEELLRRPPEDVHLEERERFEAGLRLLREPAGRRELSVKQRLQEKRLRGLRTEEAAFRDDGPQKAWRLLQEEKGGIFLQPSDRQLLEEASQVQEGQTFEKLDELRSLQEKLLDRWLVTQESPTEPTWPLGLKQAILRVIQRIHERLCQSALGERDILEEYFEALHYDPRGVKRLLENYASVYAATCQQAVGFGIKRAKIPSSSAYPSQKEVSFDNVLVDEAARANPLDLLIPMSLASQRIVLVGDQRQLPHLLEPDVEKELDTDLHEEARKALKESLFGRLFEELRQREATDGIRRVVTLDQQFRMHPTLGAWVCEQFYRPHGESFSSPRPASEFAHGLREYQRAGREMCAGWKDLPLQDGAEVAGVSKSRKVEAAWIADEVFALLEKSPRLSIGVITFYRAQVENLWQALERRGLAERGNGGGWSILKKYRTTETGEERLRVGTVDAFQGKEFDLVFLSVVRSNALPVKENDPLQQRKKYGHLMLENRMCVAMSRQRKLLIAVGDRAMFETKDASKATPALAAFLKLCEGNDGRIF